MSKVYGQFYYSTLTESNYLTSYKYHKMCISKIWLLLISLTVDLQMLPNITVAALKTNSTDLTDNNQKYKTE